MTAKTGKADKRKKTQLGTKRQRLRRAAVETWAGNIKAM